MASQVVGILLLTGGSPATLVTVLPLIAPAAAFSALALSKGKPWMYLGAGIALALLPALLLSFAPGSLAKPQLGPLFAGALLLLLSLVLGLPAGVSAFRKRRAPGSPRTAREAFRSRAGLLAVLAAGMTVGAALAGEAAYLNAALLPGGGLADFSPEANVTITAENYQFSPRNVSVPSSKIVEVTVINRDGELHTFTYVVGAGTAQEKQYSHDLPPSTTVKFTALFPSPGTVHFWCIPHGPAMSGDFIVS